MINIDAPGDKPAADGSGTRPDLTKQPVRKIALVSFFVQDIGSQNPYKYIGLTSSGANYLADQFLSQSIAELKSGFESQGMQLMTINEVLDSETKQQAYDNFELTVGKLAKAVTGFVSSMESAAMDGGIAASATADGYKLIPAILAAGDYKNNESMGQLAKDLGVDAVMVAYIKTQTDNNSTTFFETSIATYGQNPTPRVDGKKYPGMSYNTGMFYGKSSISADKGIEIIERKKGDTVSENLNGYGKLMNQLASRLATHLKSWE